MICRQLTSALIFLILPLTAAAEGAKRVLDCTAYKTCDEGGICMPSAEKITFTVMPIKRGPQGEGPHTIGYNGITATADNITGKGPYVWSTDGDDVNTLLYASEAIMIWHQLAFTPKATSTIQFLTCKDAS